MRWFLICLAFCTAPAWAAQLTIELGAITRSCDSAQLLARTDVREIEIPADVAYKRTMRYRAVPLHALLEGVRSDDHLLFTASDGFSAPMPMSLIDNRHGSSAWLAIEDPAHPWPALPGKVATAGPFYVVWTQPQLAGIGPERWPYQLAAIRRQAPVAERFPMLAPAATLPVDDPVRRGFAVFQANCLACHTLNGGGDARMGPDLNIPHGPTEYLGDAYLRLYLRDPQSLRRWPQARMPGFAAEVMSEGDLDALLAYLHHMTERRLPAVGKASPAQP